MKTRSLGAVATYGLVSDQSLAPSWSGRLVSASDHTLLRLRRRPGDRTALVPSRLWTDQ
jgi:hypothetical protein